MANDTGTWVGCLSLYGPVRHSLHSHQQSLPIAGSRSPIVNGVDLAVRMNTHLEPRS
jgi:hypothetical protein